MYMLHVCLGRAVPLGISPKRVVWNRAEQSEWKVARTKTLDARAKSSAGIKVVSRYEILEHAYLAAPNIHSL